MRNVFAAMFLAAVLLSGCGTPPLQGKVTSFHVLDATPKTFIILPDTDQKDSLEFRSYAALVRDQLRSRGWREATSDSAEVGVFVQYQISQGRQVAFSYPIFGQVPTGSSTTSGTVNTYGSTSTFNATTTRQTTAAVVGTGVGSRTEFDRALRLVMYSLPTYRSTQKMDRVYEGEIRSSGSTGDLPTVMPVLVRGLLEDFPGRSGVARSVAVPFPPRQ